MGVRCAGLVIVVMRAARRGVMAGLLNENRAPTWAAQRVYAGSLVG